MNRASFSKFAGVCLCLAAAVSLGQNQSQAAAPPAGSPALDYQFFKTRVEPVFLTKRDGHSRCVVCHTANNAPFHLVPLTPGSKAWNEEQSQQNFQLIQRVAIPGSMDSPLVHHPLAQGGRRRSASRRRSAIPVHQRSGVADPEGIRDGREGQITAGQRNGCFGQSDVTRKDVS